MLRILGCFILTIFIHGAQAQARLAYHEFEAENITKIHLFGSFCDVNLSHDQKIRFLGEIEGTGRPEDFSIFSDLTSTGTLVIRVKHRGRKANHINKARIRLEIPKGVILTVENTTGDIRGENLISGSYQFKTTSGDISLTDVIGTVNVETTSGDIALDNLQGNGYISTTSGDKKISNVQGKVKSSGTSGATYIHNIIGNIEVSSTSGNVMLKMIKGSVDASSTSGNIYAHKLLVTGNSSFALISGNLKMDLSNPYDDLKFQLVSGTGRIQVNGNSFESMYLEGDGPIMIDGATGSGNLDLHF